MRDTYLIAQAIKEARDDTLKQVIGLVEEQRDSGVLDLEQLLADLRKLKEGSRG